MAKEKKKQTKYFTKALRCPDGTRKYIRGKTQAELDRKVREAQAQLGMGININDDTTVVELAQTWVDVYKRPKMRVSSIKAILTTLNVHIIPFIGAKRVRDVKPADCANVMSKAQNGGLSHGTQRNILAVMKSLFNCAIENGIIQISPVTRSVIASGRKARERVPLTRAQVEELLSVCLKRGKHTEYTFVMLCAFAGLRAAEALGLSLKNVDFQKGIVKVREQYCRDSSPNAVTDDLKTDSSRRDIPIPPILLAHLESLRKEKGDGYIFDVDNPSLRQNINGNLQRMCRVNNDGTPRTFETNNRTAVLDFYVHPHLLRHTYATICFEQGLDVKEVQYLLGHSSPDMTMKVYLHYLATARQEDTARKIDKAFQINTLAVTG